jgi:hypothetical protein
MSDTDKLMTQLADRARQASEHVHTVTTRTKDELESEVAAVRASVEQMNDKLEQEGAEAYDEASKRMAAIRQSWSDHIAEIRRKADAVESDLDVKRAQHRAANAEVDAVAAVEIAMLAVEVAEYEVLDAVLKRAEADELATAKV